MLAEEVAWLEAEQRAPLVKAASAGVRVLKPAAPLALRELGAMAARAAEQHAIPAFMSATERA